MQNSLTKRKPHEIAGAILTVLPGVLLIFSSAVKLAGVPAVRHEMAAIGFAGGKLMFIAVLEIVSAALLIVPRTRSLGILLVSAYWVVLSVHTCRAPIIPKRFVLPSCLLSPGPARGCDTLKCCGAFSALVLW